MPKFQLPAIDFKAVVEDFKTLDPKDPGLWPLIPRAIILVGVFAVVLSLAWWLGWRVQQEELETKRRQEEKLKEEWVVKKRQAINLDEHRKQLAEINRSFGALLKQLPNASEMESLLIDINQAGLGRGLQFELFKPGAEVAKDFYAELPITLRISGGYHDLGAFAGDVAKLPRIVTLNDIDVAPAKEGGLSLSAIAKTFRYLDEEELARQRKEKEKEKAAKGKGGKK
ncbi:MAG: type 4a pilus biogenesis protein PilO [Rhodocyclaceae bacterium]|nr:type 4a pilus biogenesis protein PilO [Rhodocyclaceae bacterium]